MLILLGSVVVIFFFFNDTATTEIYTLSLHDALPISAVVTPNLQEAEALVGSGPRRELAERIHEFGAAAVVVTGGHGDESVDHLFDGERHVEIPVERYDTAATHGAGCTHSATLAAALARGLSLEQAAREAARVASDAVRH